MKHITRISIAATLMLTLTLNAFAAQPVQAATQTHFRLEANAGWVDSGFFAVAGQQLAITAFGQAITARVNIFGPGTVMGPDGSLAICPNYEGAPACAMDGAPYGALVGKIGADGTPFLIGSNYSFIADTSGDLYLAVNDLLPYYSDNYGNYMVSFSSQPAQFRLQANAGWVDSGYFAVAGQQVMITAYGQAVTAPIEVFGSGSVSGPDGQSTICNFGGDPSCAMENAPFGALVGRIGTDGTPFLIGSSYTFTAGTSGDLYLAVNDLLPYYADNYGNYMVLFNH